MKKERPSPATKPPVKRPRKFFVHIDRDEKVQAARLELPVCLHEQQIIEAIHDHDVVLITGATGTGKTTQVPQFLVEDGFGDARAPPKAGVIAVTQPRRVAAVTCASRVAHEMRTKIGGRVGYAVRHDSRCGPETAIKFVTDGVLLREVERDLMLRRYSVVIVDEAHERSLNTDLLLAFLSRSVRLRREKLSETLGPLKVIIMSATLDVEGVFSGNAALFPNPPVVSVPSRQHPITIHFAKRTSDDYIEQAFKKVSKIHRRLPPGGVLIFLSGRQEVEELCSKLDAEFAEREIKLPDSDGPPIRMKVLPFYSMLPDNLQQRVFQDVDSNFRKVVVATNIAETSVTVPGISYVVDSGRVKQKALKRLRCGHLTTFDIVWISQASAQQRAGRAGRTGPGHCYRLYSSAVFGQQFTTFTPPEILRVPADAVVLRLRALGIRQVAAFPFPTRPDAAALTAAETLLRNLGALASDGLLGVSPIGRALARLPLEPRLGRLVLAAQSAGNSAMALAARVAGVLSVGSILLRDTVNRQTVDAVAHSMLRVVRSDILRETAVLCAVEHAARHGGRRGLDMIAMRPLAQRLGVHVKAAAEALAIAEQVSRAIAIPSGDCAITPPDDAAVRAVAQAVVAAFGDRVARKVSREKAATLGVIPRLAGRAFEVQGRGGAVLVAGESVVRVRAGDLVCFTELEEVVVRRKRDVAEDDVHDEYVDSEEEEREEEEMAKKENGKVTDGERRVVMRGVSAVRAEWVAGQATGLCRRRGVADAGVVYDTDMQGVVREAIVSYGEQRWPLGRMAVAVAELGEDGGSNDTARAFARALIDGAVCKSIELPSGVNRDVATRAMARVVRSFGLRSLADVRVAGTQCIQQLASTAAACVDARRGELVGQQWMVELREMQKMHEAEDALDDELMRGEE